MARLHKLEKFDIENTYWGASVSLWFNYCPHRCVGCWNEATWDKDDSLEINNKEIIKEVLEGLDAYYPLDLTLLGGEPLSPMNQSDLMEILLEVKRVRPHTRVLSWTGYRYEQIKNHPAMPYIDILIDGRFVQELKVEGKKYGSTNQRIIDVQKTRLTNNKEIIIAPEEYK